MTEAAMKAHTLAMLDLFKRRGMTEEEACAVMGNALTHLIKGERSRRSFVATLERSWHSKFDS